MTDNFERNASPKTLRDVEAEGIALLLTKRDREYEINLDFPRYLERELSPVWSNERYGTLQVFVDTDGKPIIIARHEDPSMYDEEGSIKTTADIRYRFYLEDVTREVTIPNELSTAAVQTMGQGHVGLYDATEATLRELARREDASMFAEDLDWLKNRFGDSLSIARPQLSIPRLESQARVIGVSLDNFLSFSEMDF